MRIAITGTTGRVGAALARHFSATHDVIALPRRDFDLADPPAMQRVLDGLRCDALLNPAGITSVDACEDDPLAAHQVNTEAPALLATWCAASGVRFIHFSTDYVFDGNSPGLRREDEAAEPLSVYGRTKRAGELAVLACHPAALVLRVSWVFGPEKPSFVDQIAAAALRGDTLEAVADKWSLPTYTKDLCQWIAALLASDACGVLHACQSGPPVSWHSLAAAVIEELVAAEKLTSATSVHPQRLADMTGFRAPRPVHTAMANDRLAAITGARPRDWRLALHEYLAARS